ncbi:MAG: ligase-associated DNA damage response endonuclease PdeM [Rhodobacteraceae bacterium]|nr:ligase-associated DNA damage response endonuclease PdeM [Paracoccaceae bacterium]
MIKDARAHSFTLAGEPLEARASGALHWPARRLLCVSDLHLGRAMRLARRGGSLLPPYEGQDTLLRLEADIAATRPETVVCLGDSFDNESAAGEMDEPISTWLTRLMAGRSWIWIAGNHDPAPLPLGGAHLRELREGALVFRHIAEPGAAPGEVSGHYHPKARMALGAGRSLGRPCFLLDRRRAILPAYGTYTGGLSWEAPALQALMAPGALAVITGSVARAVPVPRGGQSGHPQPPARRGGGR